MTISAARHYSLPSVFSGRVQEKVSLKRYTAARIGGYADYLVAVHSADELSEIVRACWEQNTPFILLGSGSNVLVSDQGVRQLVILNQAKKVRFNLDAPSPTITAESGANLGALARRAAARGFSGLEWAVDIPGTVGGAVYGNAGAHGSDMSTTLLMANILHLKPSNSNVHHEIMLEEWTVEMFEYAYRTSSLKRQSWHAVVLAATIQLLRSSQDAVQAKMKEYHMKRRSSQPSGASLGSIFKNPPGDYAGRLIEAAGLKGRQIGQVEVSKLHANFFVNLGEATASDYYQLVKLVQQEVADKFGVRLETEIELMGDWREAQG